MALRLYTGVFRSSPVTSLCAEAGEPPLTIRGNQVIAQYLLRIKRLPDTVKHNAILDPEVSAPYEMYDHRTRPVGLVAQPSLRALSMENINILSGMFPEMRLWKLNVNFCRDLCKYIKANINGETFKLLVFEHLREHHSDKVLIYTHGSKAEQAVRCVPHSAIKS